MSTQNALENERRKMNLEREYRSYFPKFFESMKQNFRRSIGLKGDDELSSTEVALRGAIESLPCPVSILRLEINTNKYENAKDRTYHLIKYEFSKPGDSSLSYFGEIELEEIDKYPEASRNFAFSRQKINEIVSWRSAAYEITDHSSWVFVIPFDILKSKEHANYFKFLLTGVLDFDGKILCEFRQRRKIDYNSKYGLKRDPILTLPELLKIDKTATSFSKTEIEDLQRRVSNCQLIPKVPKQVKHVYNAAKKLYIFGYFDCYFFTISQHYAFLALESALRNKHSEIYGNPKQFIKLKTIINELENKGLITTDESELYHAGGGLRNSLSHLTNPPVMPPSAFILESVAHQINQIYHRELKPNRKSSLQN